MFDNLILSLNIVLPLLLAMVAGYIARGMNMVSEKTVTQMNNLVFRIFLPLMLMNNIRGAKFGELDGLSALIYAMVSLLALFVVLMVLVPRFEKENSRRGVIVQALFRSNYAIFGLAVLASMYPGEVLTIPSLMTPATVPLYNVLAVVCLEAFRGGKVSMKELVGKIVRNPLIIACVCGIALLAVGNPVPKFLDDTFKNLGGLATTLALFVLGASFRLETVRGNGRLLTVVTTLKLVIIPLIVLLPAIAMGYRTQALASLMIALGGPVAVSSFTMAQQMDADADLAGQLVITTTLFSVLSLFVFIFVFKMLGLL